MDLHPDSPFDEEETPRYGFYLTVNQLRLGREVMALVGSVDPKYAGKEGEEELYVLTRQKLHEFFFSLLAEAHKKVNTDSYCCTFTRCMLILCLNEEGHLKAVHNYSQPLAALQWIFRSIMYNEVRDRAKEESPDCPDLVASAANVVDLVAKKLLVGPYHQVQVWLERTRHLAFSGGQGSICWSAKDATLVFTGTPIPIKKYGYMLENMTNDVENIFAKEILFGKDIPFEIPDHVYDDPSCSATGYSFATDVGNRKWCGKYADNFLAKKVIGEDPELARKMLAPGGEWVKYEARQWFLKLQAVKEKIGLLLKLACGGSLRDSEQLEALLSETPTARRSFFFVAKEMVMAIEYDKMSYMESSDGWKPMPHTLYPELAKVMAKYILIVHPFELFLRRLLSSEPGVYEKYKRSLFVDEKGPYDEKTLTNILGELTLEYFGRKLTSANLRHITQAIITHTTPPEFLTTGLVNYGMKSLNHSEATARAIYALAVNSIGSMDPEELEQFMKVCI